MDSLQRAIAGLLVVGSVAGLASLVVVLQSSHVRDPLSAVIFGPGIGWAFVATGLFAVLRRPTNRFGVLMTAVGFAWFAGALAAADEYPVFVAGALVGAIPYALLVHMLLAFPDGNLRGRLDRFVAGAAYVSATVGQWAPLLLLEIRRLDCECPRHSLLVPQDPGGARLVFAVQATVSFLILVGTVVSLKRRARRAGGVRATELRPLLLTGAVVTVLLVAAMLTRAGDVPTGVRDAVRIVALASCLLIPVAFLVGLLRTRLSQSAALADLVSRLAATDGARGDLRQALAEALGDPSVRLAYWVPEHRGYVDADGRPVALEEARPGRRWTAIEQHGRPVAAFLHDAAVGNQSRLVRAVGAAAALTLENERLAAELRAKVEELRASRARVVESGLAERRRLERDLHDGAQQRLVSLALTLGLARSRAPDDGFATLLESADAQLEGALEELRELARGIHPPVLSDRGLGGALDALASRVPLPVEIVAAPAGRLPESLEAAVYFTVAEALTNITRYAQASHATVSVTRRADHLLIEVADDGLGGADPARGSGLRGLSDRLGALGGHVTVTSEPGNGTTVRGRIPCAW